MCGIAGVIAGDVAAVRPEALRRAADAIRFRGRDGEGTWTDGAFVHLLHSRLAIVDAPHGAQPMASTDDRYVVTFGGEIHNHVELRRTYEAGGARFRTACDTEVILEGYRLRGADVVDDLVGMFAFAVWDTHRHELFLARDRLGEKPLFWFDGDDGLWFGSTCDVFRGASGWDGRLSDRALAEMAAAGSLHSSSSIYERVRVVEPASCATVRPGDRTVRSRPYWQLGFEPTFDGPVSAMREAYRSTLDDAVGIRLRADVPVGITFSGGVDSGTIAALASSRAPVPCFTFDHHTPEDPSEETERARTVAARLGLPWHFESYDYRLRFVDDLRDAYRWFDQPSWQPELVHVWRVAREIRSQATVGLTGIGADEILNGYRGDERLRRLDLLAAPARRIGLRSVASRIDPADHLERRLRATAAASPLGGLGDAIEPTLVRLRDDTRRAGARTALEVKTLYSLTWSNVEALMRTPDIAGLAEQVELRAPFLDHRVVDLALRLPAGVKVRWPWTARGNKWIAKELYATHVGRELAYASKLNMGANLHWELEFARQWRDVVQDAIASVRNDGFDTAPAEAAWRRYVDDVDHGRPLTTYNTVFRTVMLGLWLDLRDART